MYESHAHRSKTGGGGGGGATTPSNKPMDRPYLVRRSHSTPCSESDNNLEAVSSSSSNAPVTRSQSNKRIIPPYSNRSLANSPPNTPNKLTGSQGKLNQNNKLIALKIVLLDDSVTIIQAQTKALGRVVFDQVCKQLNILEADYFGLEYSAPTTSNSTTTSTASSPPPLSSSSSLLNSSLISSSTTTRSQTTYWLDLEKRLNRQVAFNIADPGAFLRFSVKFYTPDPSQLEEEFTRYLFSLQIKRDLQQGNLHCNDNTAALMASYIVQAECGDFSEEDYPDASYLSLYKFIPHQDYEIERKIRENHKKHIGQSPAEADLHLLETSRRTELYGIRMHQARDEDGVNLNLSVCHNGLLVFQNYTKINTFSWAKIRKLSFKRKRFILKLHPEISDGYYKDLVEFIFDSRNECKAYWKRCVEHHAFFRCEKAPNPIHRSKGLLSSRGSSFRYSGRTQKQMVQFVRENFVKRPTPMGGAGGGGGAVTPAPGGPVTTGGVLVPDVSSSDNNSFDNSIVSGEHREHMRGGGVGRGGDGGGGGGSGRFQRSSSLRSAASAHAGGGQGHHPQQHPGHAQIAQHASDYNNVLSKSLSTIASKNYEEDTVIYTTRAEANAAMRAAAATNPGVVGGVIAVSRDPDWFYWTCKELSHVLTVLGKDLRILTTHVLEKPGAGTHASSSSYVFPNTMVTQTETLAHQVNSLMREKEIWEPGRHGLEIVNLCMRYFHSNEQHLAGYVGRLEELVAGATEDYSCYLPVDAVITRPVLFCQYYLERVCRECGCCGGGVSNGGGGDGSGGNRKVNFSPLLDKKSCSSFLMGNEVVRKDPGDTSLDPPLLTKLHSTHVTLTRILEPYHKVKLHLMTTSKLHELSREMDGFTGLTAVGGSGGSCVVVGNNNNNNSSSSSNRQVAFANNLLRLTGEFLLQGILLKLNKKRGLQNRIFFLFRELLIYGTRLSSTQGFRLHGIILTRNMELLDSNMSSTLSSIPYSFSIVVKSSGCGGGGLSEALPASPEPNEKILILAAFSQQDHSVWIRCLDDAISSSLKMSSSGNGDGPAKSAIASRLFNSSEELLNNNLKTSSSDQIAQHQTAAASNLTTSTVNTQHNRSNAISHVCWHRNITIQAWEIVEKESHQISGPLLRKFKNSPGWQRLWVVFTGACLYFYKSATDATPLASLPLLGYKIELLSEKEKEQVSKEHVFKLVFKAHVYFFRAESGYTFRRWVAVLRNAMITNNDSGGRGGGQAAVGS